MSKFIIFFTIAVACAMGAPANPALEAIRKLPALYHEEVHDEFGQYSLRYVTAEGTIVVESGHLVPNPDGEGKVMFVEGEVTYVGDDGQIYNTKYSAGVDGVQVETSHKPVDVSALPVPAVPLASTVEVSAVPGAPVFEVSAVPLAPAVEVSAVPLAPAVEVSAVPVAPAVEFSAVRLAPAVEVSALPASSVVEVAAIPAAPLLPPLSIPVLSLPAALVKSEVTVTAD